MNLQNIISGTAIHGHIHEGNVNTKYEGKIH
jgi:hypothetical protein